MPKKNIITSNKAKLIIIIIVYIVILIIIFRNGFPKTANIRPAPYPSQSSQIPTTVFSNPNAKCHIKGVLPDPACTPGSTDPNVRQENIQETICKSGYTKKVRPPVSYTNKLKKQQIAEYGYTDTDLRNYEEDHLISLELGGAPYDPKNLWPEPGRAPNPKDRIENLCHKKVCNGEITLAHAQQEIASNWPTACQ